MSDDKYEALAQHLGAAVAVAVAGAQKGKTMAKPSKEYDALERQIIAAGLDVDEAEPIFDEWVARGFKAASDLIVRYKASGVYSPPRDALEATIRGLPVSSVKAARPVTDDPMAQMIRRFTGDEK